MSETAEKIAVFEERIPLSPKDLNRLAEIPTEDILLEKIRAKLEGRCARHGYVVPGSLEVLSRSMGHIEMGRFTGDTVYQVQAQGKVLNPVDGTIIVGEVLKKNKMGIYVEYRDAIHVILPRDLHRGSDFFEGLAIGQSIKIEIKKSMFQVNDQFIKCVGVLVADQGSVTVAAATVPAKTEEEQATEDVDNLVAELTTAEEENTTT